MPTGGGPVFIGIAGGSASGKTTLALELARVLAPLRVRVLNMDHFYRRGRGVPRYHSSLDGRRHPHWNHPGAMRWGRLEQACRAARDADVLILEGLFALYRASLVRRMDLTIFVDCPTRERWRRRMARGEKGWDAARLRLYLGECVEAGFRGFMRPTRRRARHFASGNSHGLVRRRRAVSELARRIRGLNRGPMRSGARVGAI